MKTRNHLILLVLAGLLLVALTGCGGGGGGSPTSTATLAGQIVRVSDGTGVAGATVHAGGVSGPTDANGNFTLTGVPTGNQQLTVTATGYVLGTGSVTVTIATAGTTLSRPIVLVPTGDSPPGGPSL
jgi:hypothetical protein